MPIRSEYDLELTVRVVVKKVYVNLVFNESVSSKYTLDRSFSCKLFQVFLLRCWYYDGRPSVVKPNAGSGFSSLARELCGEF